jgi:hypothetical protein
VLGSSVGEDGMEIVGQTCFRDHLIMGIKQRHDPVVRVSINAPIECHGRSPQLSYPSGDAGFTSPDGTA